MTPAARARLRERPPSPVVLDDLVDADPDARIGERTHARNTTAHAMFANTTRTREEFLGFAADAVPVLRGIIPPSGFDPSAPMPAFATQPFIADPRGVGLNDTYAFDCDAVVSSSGPAADVPAYMCAGDCLVAEECTRSTSCGLPERTVTFPWGDVQYP